MVIPYVRSFYYMFCWFVLLYVILFYVTQVQVSTRSENKCIIDSKNSPIIWLLSLLELSLEFQ